MISYENEQLQRKKEQGGGAYKTIAAEEFKGEGASIKINECGDYINNTIYAWYA